LFNALETETLIDSNISTLLKLNLHKLFKTYKEWYTLPAMSETVLQQTELSHAVVTSCGHMLSLHAVILQLVKSQGVTHALRTIEYRDRAAMYE